MIHLASVFSSIGPYLLLALGLGFVIFVHELGHFLAAKAVGIKVTQFAIGFGQSLLTWRKGIGFKVGTTEPIYAARVNEELKRRGEAPQATAAETVEPSEKGRSDAVVSQVGRELGLGETEYRFNWVPLGGYVKMLGQEDLDPNAQSDDPRAYNRKPIWQRAIVISAGVIMNMIFAVIFFIIAFLMGVDFPPAVVGGVVPDMPAATVYAEGHEGEPAYQGLQVGDRVVTIDGDPARGFMGLTVAVGLSGPEQVLRLAVDRPTDDGVERLHFRIKPTLEGDRSLPGIGVARPQTLEIVGAPKDVLPEAWITDAETEETQGPVIVAVNGQPVEHHYQFVRAVRASEGEPVTLTVQRDGRDATDELTCRPEPSLQFGEARNLMGLVPTYELTPTEDSPAAEAGVQPGDRLAGVDDLAWPTFPQLRERIATAHEQDRPVVITVMRDGELIELDPITPVRGGSGPIIGVGIGPAMDHPTISGALEGTPAAELDLPGGTTILAINDTAVDNWADMQQVLAGIARQADGDSVNLTLRYQVPIKDIPPGEATVTLDADALAGLRSTQWVAPLAMGAKLETVRTDGVVEATVLGMEYTHLFVMQTYTTILRLAQQRVSVSELRGPIGIVQIGATTAERGVPYLLFFLGLISVNLAVINFLPIPIVDGGHIVFLIIEKVKGSPLDARWQTVAFFIGLALIGTVMIYTFYADIARLL